MALIVQKYGGSSVATPERIVSVAEQVVRRKRQGNKVVIVVSAMGKTTDSLISLARQVHPDPPTREMDRLLSTGELVSVALLCMAIERLGEQAEGLSGRLAGIRTDSTHTKARIRRIDPRRIRTELEKDAIVVVAGFQGVGPENVVTTLGRGGSDLTAIAIAAALKADVCEIYTDVDGVYTADPRRVPAARLLSEISYDELLEMASSGAKVMQSRSVECAKKYGVPFLVKSSFQQGAGTMVREIKVREGAVVSAVSIDENQAKITIFHVPDRPGIAAAVFGELGDARINVDMIVQNVSREKHTDISFTVSSADRQRALEIARRVAKEIKAGEVGEDADIAKISIIGIGMMNQPGVAGRMFRSLAEQGVNIQMISTSEIRISCLVPKEDGERALRAVHAEFIEHPRTAV